MAVSFKNQIQNTTDLKTIIKSQLKYFKSYQFGLFTGQSRAGVGDHQGGVAPVHHSPAGFQLSSH